MFIVCNQNVQCRTFDYDSYSLMCRLFEGAVETGQVIPSGSLTSRVGSVRLQPSFFAAFGQPCAQCTNTRYLVCPSKRNNTCQCPQNTFWNGVQCENQVYEDSNCSNNQWCRTDLELTCSNLHFCTGKMRFVSCHSVRDENKRENADCGILCILPYHHFMLRMATVSEIDRIRFFLLGWNQCEHLTTSTGTKLNQLFAVICLTLDSVI